MLKRFVDGLAFGAGFSIAFAIVWIVVWMLLMPVFISSQFDDSIEPMNIEGTEPYIDAMTSFDRFEEFDEMSVDEQIAAASVIALAHYESESAEDGRTRAVISEFLKLDEGQDFRFEIGDEYHNASFYPSEDSQRGNGVLVFFTGSPARMEFSVTLYGDRIPGLNDIPLDLFREKCAEAE